MESEDEASLDIVCADSEDNILLNNDGDSFGCLSEEDVDVVQPPFGRMIETKDSDLVDALRVIAKSSPSVADSILQNTRAFDKQLKQIARSSSMPSSFAAESRDEIVRKPSVTVVDYPTNDRVEVFGPLADEEEVRDGDEREEDLMVAPSSKSESPEIDTSRAQNGSGRSQASPASSMRPPQSPASARFPVSPAASVQSGRVSAQPSSGRPSPVNAQLSPTNVEATPTPQSAASPRMGTPKLATPRVGTPQSASPRVGTPQSATPKATTPKSTTPQSTASREILAQTMTPPEVTLSAASSINGQASPTAQPPKPEAPIAPGTATCLANEHTPLEVHTDVAQSGPSCPLSPDVFGPPRQLHADAEVKKVAIDKLTEEEHEGRPMDWTQEDTTDDEDTEDEGSLDLGLSGPPRSISKQKEEESEDEDSDVDSDADEDSSEEKDEDEDEIDSPVSAGAAETDKVEQGMVEVVSPSEPPTPVEAPVPVEPTEPEQQVDNVEHGDAALDADEELDDVPLDDEQETGSQSESKPSSKRTMLRRMFRTGKRSKPTEEQATSKKFLSVVGRSLTPLKERLSTRKIEQEADEQSIQEVVQTESNTVDLGKAQSNQKRFMSAVSRNLTPLKFRLSARGDSKSQPVQDQSEPVLELNSQAELDKTDVQIEATENDASEDAVEETKNATCPDDASVEANEDALQGNSKKHRGLISLVGRKLPKQRRQKPEKSQLGESPQEHPVVRATSSTDDLPGPANPSVADVPNESQNDQVDANDLKKLKKQQRQPKHSKQFINLLGRAVSPRKARLSAGKVEPHANVLDTNVAPISNAESHENVESDTNAEADPVAPDDYENKINSLSSQGACEESKTIFNRALRTISPTKILPAESIIPSEESVTALSKTPSTGYFDSTLLSVGSCEIEATFADADHIENRSEKLNSTEHDDQRCQDDTVHDEKEQEADVRPPGLFQRAARALSPPKIRRQTNNATKTEISLHGVDSALVSVRSREIEAGVVLPKPSMIGDVEDSSEAVRGMSDVTKERGSGGKSNKFFRAVGRAISPGRRSPKNQHHSKSGLDKEMVSAVPADVSTAPSRGEESPIVVIDSCEDRSVQVTSSVDTENGQRDESLSMELSKELPLQEPSVFDSIANSFSLMISALRPVELQQACQTIASDFERLSPIQEDRDESSKATFVVELRSEDTVETKDGNITCADVSCLEAVSRRSDELLKTESLKEGISGEQPVVSRKGEDSSIGPKKMEEEANGGKETSTTVGDNPKVEQKKKPFQNFCASRSRKANKNSNVAGVLQDELAPEVSQSAEAPAPEAVIQNNSLPVLSANKRKSRKAKSQHCVNIQARSAEVETEASTPKVGFFTRSLKSVGHHHPKKTGKLSLDVVKKDEKSETTPYRLLSPDQSIQRKIEIDAFDAEVETKPTSPKSSLFFGRTKSNKPEELPAVSSVTAERERFHCKQLSPDQPIRRKVDIQAREAEVEAAPTSPKSSFFSGRKKAVVTTSLDNDKQVAPEQLSPDQPIQRKVDIHAREAEVEAQPTSPKSGFFSGRKKSDKLVSASLVTNQAALETKNHTVQKKDEVGITTTESKVFAMIDDKPLELKHTIMRPNIKPNPRDVPRDVQEIKVKKERTVEAQQKVSIQAKSTEIEAKLPSPKVRFFNRRTRSSKQSEIDKETKNADANLTETPKPTQLRYDGDSQVNAGVEANDMSGTHKNLDPRSSNAKLEQEREPITAQVVDPVEISETAPEASAGESGRCTEQESDKSTEVLDPAESDKGKEIQLDSIQHQSGKRGAFDLRRVFGGVKKALPIDKPEEDLVDRDEDRILEKQIILAPSMNTKNESQEPKTNCSVFDNNVVVKTNGKSAPVGVIAPESESTVEEATVENQLRSKLDTLETICPSTPKAEIVQGRSHSLSPKVEITESEYEKTASASRSTLGRMFLGRSLSPKKTRKEVTPILSECDAAVSKQDVESNTVNILTHPSPEQAVDTLILTQSHSIQSTKLAVDPVNSDKHKEQNSPRHSHSPKLEITESEYEKTTSKSKLVLGRMFLPRSLSPEKTRKETADQEVNDGISREDITQKDSASPRLEAQSNDIKIEIAKSATIVAHPTRDSKDEDNGVIEDNNVGHKQCEPKSPRVNRRKQKSWKSIGQWASSSLHKAHVKEGDDKDCVANTDELEQTDPVVQALTNDLNIQCSTSAMLVVHPTTDNKEEGNDLDENNDDGHKQSEPRSPSVNRRKQQKSWKSIGQWASSSLHKSHVAKSSLHSHVPAEPEAVDGGESSLDIQQSAGPVSMTDKSISTSTKAKRRWKKPKLISKSIRVETDEKDEHAGTPIDTVVNTAPQSPVAEVNSDFKKIEETQLSIPAPDDAVVPAPSDINGDMKVDSKAGNKKTEHMSSTMKAGKLLSKQKQNRSRKAITRAPLSPRNADSVEIVKPDALEVVDKTAQQTNISEHRQVSVHAVSADNFSTGLTPKHDPIENDAKVNIPKHEKLAQRRKKRIAKLVGDEDSTTGVSLDPRTRSGHWWKRGPASSGVSAESPANASTATKEFDKHMRVCAISDEDVVEQAKQKEKAEVPKPYRRDGRRAFPVNSRPPMPERMPVQPPHAKQGERKTVQSTDDFAKPSRREKLAKSKQKLNRAADDDVSAADETFNDNLSDVFAPPEVTPGGWLW